MVDCWLLFSIIRSRCRSFTIVDVVFLSPSFREFIWLWVQTISFRFCLSIAIQYGAVELLTKSSGYRNRLRHKIAQTMTCSSSLNYGSIVQVGLLLEFWAQTLSNDAFITILRHTNKGRQYITNRFDGTPLHTIGSYQPRPTITSTGANSMQADINNASKDRSGTPNWSTPSVSKITLHLRRPSLSRVGLACCGPYYFWIKRTPEGSLSNEIACRTKLWNSHFLEKKLVSL